MCFLAGTLTFFSLQSCKVLCELTSTNSKPILTNGKGDENIVPFIYLMLFKIIYYFTKIVRFSFELWNAISIILITFRDSIGFTAKEAFPQIASRRFSKYSV